MAPIALHKDRNASPWPSEGPGTAPGSAPGPAAAPMAGGPAAAGVWRSVSACSAAPVPGRVGGAVQSAPAIAGRTQPAAALDPRAPAPATAAARGAQAVNRVINGIERTRQADGSLSPRASALLVQVARIAEACQWVASGSPDRSESLVAERVQLEALVKEEASAHPASIAGQPQGAGSAGPTLAGGLQALHALPETEADAPLAPLVEEIQAWTEEIGTQAADRLKYLDQALGSSPFSLQRLYETKAATSEAAVQVLEEALTHYTGEEPGRERLLAGKARLEERRDRLRAKAEASRGLLGRPEEFGATPKPTGLARLLHPFKARAEHAARERHVARLLAGDAPEELDTPGTNEMSVIEDALADILTQAGAVSGNVHRRVEHAFQELIDANPRWREPIRNEIHLTQAVPPPEGGPPATPERVAHSEITPAAQFFPSYRGRGVNAHRSTEGRHAVNLARTRLEDADGKALFAGVRHGVVSAFGLTAEGVAGMEDEELAQQVRTLLPQEDWQRDTAGAPDLAATAAVVRKQPVLIERMRAAANRNRAVEILALTVLADPELHRAALEGRQPRVDLLSLSLLTPDSFRRGLDDNESLMLADQARAWKSLAGPQTIELPGVDGGPPVAVTVLVNPIALNYGVNQGAVKGIGGVQPDAVSGWHVSDELNAQGLQALFGEDLSHLAESRTGVLGERLKALVDRHAAELEAAGKELQWRRLELMRLSAPGAPGNLLGLPPQERERIAQQKLAEVQRCEERVKALRAQPQDQGTPLGAALELVRQIAAIHRDGAYRKAGGEPYKMPTRLAVLADLLGVKVAFNCKSGKDRTGELDAEIKHFKLQMAATGRVPHYQRERTPEEIRNFREVVTQSGNFEMQRLNTGFAGYKLKGVSSLFAQFGGRGSRDALTRNFHGLSALTAS